MAQFNTKSDVTYFLGELQSALWKLHFNLKPAAMRLLSLKHEEMARQLEVALHDAAMKLHRDKKPVGWRKGQRVTVAAKFGRPIRMPVPKAGTRGKVDRVFENEYGWWIVVSFISEFDDIDGLTWLPDESSPINVWFKPNEIRKGWDKQ